MRVITWNVARRSSRLAEQGAALAVREPDVVALQEVTDTTLPLWRAVLERIGLPHVRASLDDADPSRAPARRRRTGVLVASGSALRDPSVTLPVPWTETALAAVAGSAIGPIEIHCLARSQRCQRLGESAARFRPSAPGSKPRRRWPAWCAAISTHPGASSRAARCSPSPEARAGACGRSADPSGTRPSSESFPDCGTSATATPIARFTATRSREPSWTWQRISGHGGGWRLDHLFSSPELEPTTCVYHHSWRDEGLSDHSALEADLVRRE